MFLIAIAVAQQHADQIRIDSSLALVAGFLIVGLFLLLTSQALAARSRVRVLEEGFARRVQDFLTGEKDQIRAEQSAIARREAQVALADWKTPEGCALRRRADRFRRLRWTGCRTASANRLRRGEDCFVAAHESGKADS